jgi:hypothetical protein
MAILSSTRLALMAGAVALAGPVFAHQVAPTPVAQIPSAANTVSGVTVNAPQKADPLVDPSSQFVREHLPQSIVSEQYPRFRDDVCVKVLGLPPEFDAFVAHRIVEIARQVKAPVATAADCKPNVHVIFTPDPKAQLADIARRKDILLGFYYSQAQRQKLATAGRPIEARYVTRIRDDNGQSHLEIHDPRVSADPPTGRAGSRLSNGMSTEVVHSLIVADANKVAGEKIDTIADYVAVIALARWQGLERCNAMPTILNRMADGCDKDSAPEAATPQDLALLTGLYAVQSRELGSQQRATIASAIRKAGEGDPR